MPKEQKSCWFFFFHYQAQIAFTIARPNVKIYLQNELSSLGVNLVNHVNTIFREVGIFTRLELLTICILVISPINLQNIKIEKSFNLA
jgi:hypothetical protein